MIVATLGSAMVFYITTQSVDVNPKPLGAMYYAEHSASVDPAGINVSIPHILHQPAATVSPLVQKKFRGVVRQQYDYSCGSAALTTLLRGYLGVNVNEQQTMNGLLQFGERERIIKRRSFSLLDMKRFVTALGLNSGGFKGSVEDLKGLDKPVIVPISYAGFKHFVVYKGYKDGRIFVADPALGNISFMESSFEKAWDDNTLFMITPPEDNKAKNWLKISDDDMRVVEDATIDFHAFDRVMLPQYREEQLADYARTLRKVLDADPKSSTYQQPISIPMRLYYRRK